MNDRKTDETNKIPKDELAIIQNLKDGTGSVGNIEKLTFDGVAGMKMVDLDFKEIMILVGPNGSGKTLVLVLTWVVSMLAMIYIGVKDSAKCKDILQWLLDKCFVDQDWTGKVGIKFSFLDIYFELDKGKVTNIHAVETGKLTELPMPIFMSKNTRTYEQVIAYYKVRKLLGVVGDLDIKSMGDIEKLAGMYKLYDILFMERLLTRLKAGLELRPEVTKSLNEMFTSANSQCGKIVKMGYDENTMDIYYENEKGEKKSVNSLSAGEQSMLNMLTAQ